MTKLNTISLYVDDEDKKLIVKASKIAGLNQCSFLRYSTLKEARKILTENE